eukprot:TRINITY_DN1162_c0_g2_i1.p1 TRINITY_DN1162_c0_g2~~TRINITY_DN1162_c0_g2_i1.p1  ORF type:complete len:725 (+),score=128.48 TRINITY_DN1162_c0_g2_i1:60-2234(+)
MSVTRSRSTMPLSALAIISLIAGGGAAYSVDDASADLNSLCGADTGMPNMIGCSLYSKCYNNQSITVIPSDAFYCSPVSLMADICVADPMMGIMPACANYQSACAASNPEPLCLSFPAMPHLISTSASTTDIDYMCKVSNNTATSLCPSSEEDPLSALADACMINPLVNDSTHCAGITAMCSALQATDQADHYSAICGKSCLADPTRETCKQYSYSNASQDIAVLCSQMPNMIGCGIFNRCASGVISGKFCSNFSVLGDICTDMSSMSRCKNYLSLCQSNGTQVEQCFVSLPLPGVLRTSAAVKDVLKVCSEMEMDGCEKCTAKGNCSDPLGTLSGLCLSMTMDGCEDWSGMCDSLQAYGEKGNFAAICETSPPPSVNKSCIDDPTQDQCVHFVYPNANSSADLQMLCKMMPGMIGCSIQSHCDVGQLKGKFCDSFSILADICSGDRGMFMMKGCKSFNAICGTGSKVLQCKSPGPIPNVLQTTSTVSSVQEMCSEMAMDGCGDCTSSTKCPDPLATVSKVCLSMEMSGCAGWHSMCDSLSRVGESGNFEYICGGGSGSINSDPIMRMYFHQSYADFVLFRSWVPRNWWQYTLTWFAIVLMGVLVLFLKICRHHYDEMQKQKEEAEDAVENAPLLEKNIPLARKVVHPKFVHAIMPGKKQLKQNAIRAVFAFGIVTLDFLLMLVAMTFNVGLFFAVVTGYAIGTLLFGHGLVFVEADLANCCGN